MNSQVVGPTPEPPPAPEIEGDEAAIHAGLPSVKGKSPDSENRYGQPGSPVSNNLPPPPSLKEEQRLRAPPPAVRRTPEPTQSDVS